MKNKNVFFSGVCVVRACLLSVHLCHLVIFCRNEHVNTKAGALCLCHQQERNSNVLTELRVVVGVVYHPTCCIITEQPY